MNESTSSSLFHSIWHKGFHIMAVRDFSEESYSVETKYELYDTTGGFIKKFPSLYRAKRAVDEALAFDHVSEITRFAIKVAAHDIKPRNGDLANAFCRIMRGKSQDIEFYKLQEKSR